MSALVTGASLVLTERFEAERWTAQVVGHRATLASLFATQLRMVLAQPTTGAEPDAGLRATVYAQNLAERQVTEFEHRSSCPLVQLYGMTETVALPMTETVALPLINPLYGERRNASLGRPVPHIPLRVVDSDGKDAGPGEVGQLLVGGQPGQTLMRGYQRGDPRLVRATPRRTQTP